MDDWQNGLKLIKDRGLHLLETEKWSDCRFLVGHATNQRIIAGHKLILAMTSPVFERMFFGNFSDKTDPIVIPDVQPNVFYALMEYIYSDKINITSVDKAFELFYVAHKYMLTHVVERCKHFLWTNLRPTNACRIYEFAKFFDESRLMQQSMELIAVNIREVLEDPSFLDIEVSTLMAILDQDQLNVESELDLFNALHKYATEHGLLMENTMSNAQTQKNTRPVKVEDVPLNLVDNGVVEEIRMKPADEDVNSNADDSAAQPHPQAELAYDKVVADNDTSDAETAEQEFSHGNTMYTQRIRMDENMLRQAVGKIRFLTLTPREFAEAAARSKLLKRDEALAILFKITINDYPMPEGFCSSRCHRNSLPSDATTTSDSRKLYCVRPMNYESTFLNTAWGSNTLCSVNIQVDKNIWITGVRVPTQVLRDELTNSGNYTESVYARIQSMQEPRSISSRHFTSRVRYNSLMEISFDSPVYIDPNQTYKINVEFEKFGDYPTHRFRYSDVISDGVKFMFNIGSISEPVRDDLILDIVFRKA